MAYVACNGKSVPQRIGDSPEAAMGSPADQTPGIGVRCRVEELWNELMIHLKFWMFQLVVEVARLDVSQEILKKWLVNGIIIFWPGISLGA